MSASADSMPVGAGVHYSQMGAVAAMRFAHAVAAVPVLDPQHGKHGGRNCLSAGNGSAAARWPE